MTTSIANELLAYAPELKELVKSAEQVDGLSTASKGDTLFSYVKMEFMEKVAGLTVDNTDRYRVLRASTLYDIEKQASEIVKAIQRRVQVKQASEMTKSAELVVAQDTFEAMEAGYVNQDKMVKMARALTDAYDADITSDSIKQYSCQGYLSKEAAQRSLRSRFQATKDEAFEKLASALDTLDTGAFTIDEKRKFADFVHGLDKKANLTAIGFNVYKEVFLTKAASITSALMVAVSPTKSVPVEKIIAIAPDLAGAMGPEVTKELQGDPMTVKSVVESLPLDLKGVLARYV